MIRMFMVILVCAAAVGFLACDRSPSNSNSDTTTTVRVEPTTSDLHPTTAPATLPVTSTLLIDGKLISFPAARLVIQQPEPVVHLLLFSDDPPDALQPDYHGHRFFLRLPLDIDDPAKVASTDFYSRARSMERIDSPDGIFLEGGQRMLQPYDLHVGFAPQGKLLAINLSGTFTLYDLRPEGASPKLVPVHGTFIAELEEKYRPRKREPATRP